MVLLRLRLAVAVAVAVVALALMLASVSALEATQADGLAINHLSLNAVEHAEAVLQLGQGSEIYEIGAGDDGFFIRHPRSKDPEKNKVLSVDRLGRITSHTDLFAAQALAAGDLILGGVYQWRMAALEMFHSVRATEAGWSTDEVESCGGAGGVVMLVGPHGRNHNPKSVAAVKTYSNLPPHSQVRIVGTGHFVDDWQGEVAYLQVQGHYVWTETHDQRNQVSNFNVCGESIYPESKFSVTVDVTVPHVDSTLTIAFGSTLEPGAAAWFGFSSISVQLRSQAPSLSPNATASNSTATNTTASL